MSVAQYLSIFKEIVMSVIEDDFGGRAPQSLSEQVITPVVLAPAKPAYPWYEENGVIYFSITSDGTSGEEWVSRIENKEGHDIKQWELGKFLLSRRFKPTSGLTTKVAVLTESFLGVGNCAIENIRTVAIKRKFAVPNAEIACLIWERFTDEELGKMGVFDIYVPHVPFKGSSGDLCILGVYRFMSALRLMTCCVKHPSNKGLVHGYAFVVSQTPLPSFWKRGWFF